VWPNVGFKLHPEIKEQPLFLGNKLIGTNNNGVHKLYKRFGILIGTNNNGVHK
jgi:hypothetical protein